jgi:hypothetical protein
MEFIDLFSRYFTYMYVFLYVNLENHANVDLVIIIYSIYDV